jgi:hypothetical protein
MEKIDRLGWAHRRLHRLRIVPIGGHVRWLLRAALSRFRAGVSLHWVLGEFQEGLERVLAMYKFEGSFRLSSLACRDSPPTFGRPRPDRDYDSIRVGAGGRVEHWCQGGSAGLSVPAPFVWRCLTSPGLPRTPAPPRRTVRAVCPHTALRSPSAAGMRGASPAWPGGLATTRGVRLTMRGTSLAAIPSRPPPSAAG